MDLLRNAVRGIPDFPKAGIFFYDITPLLQDARAFQTAVDIVSDRYIGAPIDVVLGVDARGFLLAPAVAYKLGKGLAIVRKSGKLPFETLRASYDLEYGKATLEMHVDAVKPGQNVLVIDDVLATGGTAQATGSLVQLAGGKVYEYCFLLELLALGGRQRLGNRVHSVLSYA